MLSFHSSATGHKCAKGSQNYCGGDWGQASPTPRGSLGHAEWQPADQCSDSLSMFHTVPSRTPSWGSAPSCHNCDFLISKCTGFSPSLPLTPYTPNSCFLRSPNKLHPSPHLGDYFCCSAAQSCPALCDPMNCSLPAFPALHYLPKFARTRVH